MSAKEKLASMLRKKTSSESLQKVHDWILTHFTETLHIIQVRGATMHWLVITSKVQNTEDPNIVQLQISYEMNYELKVMGLVKNRGVINSDKPGEDFELKCILDQLGDAEYLICSGISGYHEDKKTLGFDPRHVRQWTANDRVDSEYCTLWHKPMSRRNVSYVNMCCSCADLARRLQRLRAKAEAIATPEKNARTHPS